MASPSAAPSSPRHSLARRIFVRLAQAVLLILTGLPIAAWLWLRSDDFQHRSRILVEELVEDATGEQLSLTRVELSLLPPALELRGLHLFHGPDGPTILTVDRVVLRPSWGGRATIRLDRPRLHLHLTEDGKLREFNAAPPSDTSLDRIPFDTIVVRDGQLRLTAPDGEILLDGLTITPVAPPAHRLATTLTLQRGERRLRFPLTLEPIVLEPRAVSSPGLAIHTEPLDMEGTFRFPLEGEPRADLTASTELDVWSALLPSPWALHGTLRADVELRGRRLAANTWLESFGLDLPGQTTPVLHYRFGTLTAALRASPDRIDVDDLLARWAGGELRATGVIDPDTLELIDARIVGDSVELRRILTELDAAPNPWIDLLADAEVRVSGGLSPLHIEGDFDLAVTDLRVTDGPVHLPSVSTILAVPTAWARGRLILDADQIRLVAPEVHGPRTSGSVDVTIGFQSYGPLDLRADLTADLADLRPLGGVPLTGRGPLRGRLWGPFQALHFEGEGELDTFSVVGLHFADHLSAPIVRSTDLRSLELIGATATVGQTRYGGDLRLDFPGGLSMDTTLSVEDGRVEDLIGIALDLEQIRGHVSGTVELHGPLYRMEGRQSLLFSEVTLWGERFETGRARSVMRDGIFTLDDLRLLRARGTEGLLLRGTIGRGWSLNLDLLADGFTFQSLDNLQHRQLPLVGALHGWARIGGTLFAPEPHGTVLAQSVRYDGRFVDDSRVDFHTEGHGLVLQGRLLGEAVRLESQVELAAGLPYRADLTLDGLPLHLLYPTGADGSPIEARATGTVRVEGDRERFELDGVFDAVDLRWGGHVLTNHNPWRFRHDGEALRITALDLAGGRTDLELLATLEPTLSVQGGGRVELDLLRAVVPGLQRAEGVVEVTVSTGRDGPQVGLEVEADLLRHAGFPAALEDLHASLRLNRSRYVLQEFGASLGGGRVIASGHVDASDWRPVRTDLRAVIEDAQIRWYDALPPVIGDARLRFDGPPDALLLQGTITVEEMAFTDRIDWEDAVVEYRSEVMVDPGFEPDERGLFDVDLHIVADRSIRLDNNLIEGTASADLRVVGDTARPGLVGLVEVEDAVAVLQDRSFRVDRGQIRYHDPWTWDPEIDLRLVTDIESRNQRYRIDYQLFGPLSDWRTTTRSDPQLPQADVNALLWFGVTTDELEQSGELPTAVAQGVADLILTDLFASTQASELGEVPDLLFDRIDVATGVNGRGEYSAEPRLVVSKRLPELGNVELTWEFNLGRPEDNYLRIDKRVGGIWSLAGWYATLQRDRVLPIVGAYGVDITARWEMD